MELEKKKCFRFNGWGRPNEVESGKSSSSFKVPILWLQVLKRRQPLAKTHSWEDAAQPSVSGHLVGVQGGLDWK